VKAPLIVGHRGAPERAVENTRSSFIAALEAGASIIETDIRLTADNALVISHDPDFSRFGGPSVPISGSTRLELEQIVLRDGIGNSEKPYFMDDALRDFPAVEFSVDLKDPGPEIVHVWSELLRDRSISERCITASFRDRTLRIFRGLNPGTAVSMARFAVIHLLVRTFCGCPVSPGYGEGVLQLPERAGPLQILTPRRISRWQKAGWEVHVWTVDDEREMRRFAEWGIDGIITNKPFLLKKVLSSMEAGDSCYE